MARGKDILVVEDDADVCETIAELLTAEGYECRQAGDGAEALEEIRRKFPDLVLLDRMLPGESGDDILRDLRRDPATSQIPIIMITGKAEEADELVGLALGADDYVTKPFSRKLLAARVEAVLRRAGARATAPRERAAPIESVMVDRSSHRVRIGGDTFELSEMEYKVLTALIAARGFVLDSGSLAKTVFGADPPKKGGAIRTHVKTLCKKLGPAAEMIQEVQGVGYAFCPPPGSTIRMGP